MCLQVVSLTDPTSFFEKEVMLKFNLSRSPICCRNSFSEKKKKIGRTVSIQVNNLEELIQKWELCSGKVCTVIAWSLTKPKLSFLKPLGR